MAQFAYTARDGTGQSAGGVISASTLEEAAKQLRAAGKFVISIEPTSAIKATHATKGIKIPRAEVINLSNQLSVMLETGVTLADALECCADNHPNENVKRLVTELSESVKSGVDFSAALAKHPRSFPRLYVALIKASEKSGMMSKLLGRATQYMKDEQETLRKVKGALTYPSIMLGFAVLTTVFLLVFVMPRFTVIYANKGAALPVPTKILMTMSHFLVHQWYIVIPVVAGAVFGGWTYFKTSQGRHVKDWLQLNVPGIGGMFRKMHLSRGLRTIGTMSASGVGLVECVETAQTLTSNTYFQQ
ncbi:MAG TPA: type II secretion system F family protein, partial [Tepidisphaeraceae bacterium]|nr:type II secretion system F family protein [Tepidisphaeraceae bacterium]